MDIEEINRLEKRYFDFISNLFETKATTFTKNILSQYSLRDSWHDYTGDMTFIQKGLESIVHSLIYKNVDWELSSTPEGSDSIFQTAKAVIHVDAKAVLKTDQDAIGNKITIQKNQCSYCTENSLIYLNKTFQSNLPPIYNHKTYGEIPCLTYFVKLIYDLDSELDSFRKFKLILYSVPNGKFNPVLGTNFFQAGRSTTSSTRGSIRVNFNLLDYDINNNLKWKRYKDLDMI
ncbi:PDDEXK family nuclease [Psychroserpens sp. MEBiC05023]